MVTLSRALGEALLIGAVASGGFEAVLSAEVGEKFSLSASAMLGIVAGREGNTSKGSDDGSPDDGEAARTQRS